MNRASAEGSFVFRFFRFRFHFRALGAVRFPAGKAGNTLRGALGLALPPADPGAFRSLFEPPPTALHSSALTDPPRPFVLRAAHLDGRQFSPGDPFSFDIHSFDPAHPPLAPLRRAFELLAAEGIGPGRGRFALDRIEQLDLDGQPILVTAVPAAPPLALDLTALPPGTVASVGLTFATPTELKSGGQIVERPEFAVIFSRLRDRIAALSALYADGWPALDPYALEARARAVQLTRCALEWHRPERRSTRNGQVHRLGGFTGAADYAGDLAEFLPWLAAARWTGVGRHAVWGHGDVRLTTPAPPFRVE